VAAVSGGKTGRALRMYIAMILLGGVDSILGQ
jgi:hypothetical protein